MQSIQVGRSNCSLALDCPKIYKVSECTNIDWQHTYICICLKILMFGLLNVQKILTFAAHAHMVLNFDAQ